MSSDLYKVRVLSVEGDRLVCRVTSYDPRSEEDPPPSRTLALQFLWEPWYDFSHGSYTFVTGGPSTPEQAKELGRVAPIGRELADQDICDGDWIRANIDRFVRQVEVRDRNLVTRDCDDTDDEVLLDPQATLIISVTDPKWLEHLRPGMEWETTAFDRDEHD